MEARLSKNSKNSHKPPSSDANKKKTSSLRKKSGRKPGGQLGHPGSRLEKVTHPDGVIKHEIEHCLICGGRLGIGSEIESRQVFEMPEVRLQVTEHQAEIKACRVCGYRNKAIFPEDVTQSTQYGSKIKGLMVYLSQYHLLPYHRIRVLFQALFKHTLSSGTVVNAVSASAGRLEKIEREIKQLLSQTPVLHADESGMNINGDKHWLHVAGNQMLTHYGLHRKRGSEGMDALEILPNYRGTLIHDHWASYFTYKQATHALCNVHHLRELKFIHEVQGLKWAKAMGELLIKAYQLKKATTSLTQEQILQIQRSYQSILRQGQKEQAIRGTRDSKNLIKRLITYQTETLLFIQDPKVPFSNNQSEQDIRMIKVQQKITGGFRTQAGAQAFCVNRSILSTALKNGKDLLIILQQIFQNQLTLSLLIST